MSIPTFNRRRINFAVITYKRLVLIGYFADFYRMYDTKNSINCLYILGPSFAFSDYKKPS